MQKSKAITFKLTESEYDKIKTLADQRHMNPTEYARHTALGNRIKPTVISNESSSEDLLALKQENAKMLHMLQSLDGYIAENGFMNWHDYKNDEKVIEALKTMRTLNKQDN